MSFDYKAPSLTNSFKSIPTTPIKSHKHLYHLPYLRITNPGFHKKTNSLSPSSNKYTITEHKNTLPNQNQNLLSLYYKDPFFLNNKNLNIQLNLLKSLNNKNKSLKLNKLNKLYKLKKSDSKKIKEENTIYYNNVFKNLNIFRKPKVVLIDNKLNMKYAENELQYRINEEKEKKKLEEIGKLPKENYTSPKVENNINDAIDKIKFMKGIVDYSYPSFIVKKINYNEIRNVKKYMSLTPVERRNIEKSKINEMRKNYLMNSIRLLKNK